MTKNCQTTGILLLLVSIFGFFSCSSDDALSEEPSLIIKFKFDANQLRLNNIGQPSIIPDGNAAQSPDMKKISAHYLELAPSATTLLGQGKILYHAPETNLGGSMAIDFSQALVVGADEVFLKIPITPEMIGSYEWIRVSLAYQSGVIQVFQDGVTYAGTLDSFVGYNTFIGTHSIGNNLFPVNGNRTQGYWAFALNDFPFATSGQAPEGATTVPNPLFQTSPIPQGSCVVTGKFANNFIITGNETRDIVMTLSLSINNSFEWTEVNNDGKFEPAIGENVVDMGLRGLIPSFVN
ncbi:hypothetical protein [Flavobacterium orientale]|uniref:Lipoprotein n=1 Tax=Flavobacterium orientale TaxID=1756020 RepID=A0A916XYJ7_9FLAO|nr:hypothetical protein [Flavobacterium orientale]GGD21149.1 hypothetical protein GCM10011343_09500 [Flavobacterium orientale]